MPDVFPGMGTLVAGLEVQFATPIVDRIGIVVGDPFPADVKVRALEEPGNVGRTGLVKGIGKRTPPVIGRNFRVS